MKTTLNLNDSLLTSAKALAAQQRTSLTRLIEEGLKMRLSARRAGSPRPASGVPRQGRSGGGPRWSEQQGAAQRSRA
jgi:Family of unknown function (DUF6364)